MLTVGKSVSGRFLVASHGKKVVCFRGIGEILKHGEAMRDGDEKGVFEAVRGDGNECFEWRSGWRAKGKQ